MPLNLWVEMRAGNLGCTDVPAPGTQYYLSKRSCCSSVLRQVWHPVAHLLTAISTLGTHAGRPRFYLRLRGSGLRWRDVAPGQPEKREEGSGPPMAPVALGGPCGSCGLYCVGISKFPGRPPPAALLGGFPGDPHAAGACANLC